MTDGSAIYLRNDKIPSKCFNDKGLIMKSDEVEWLPLTDTQISSNFININIKISPDFDTITADISDVSQLYIAEEMKSFALLKALLREWPCAKPAAIAAEKVHPVP